MLSTATQIWKTALMLNPMVTMSPPSIVLAASPVGAVEPVDLEEDPLVCDSLMDAMDLSFEQKAEALDGVDKCRYHRKAKGWIRDYMIGDVSCIRPVETDQCGWVVLRPREEKLFPKFIPPEDPPFTVPGLKEGIKRSVPPDLAK
jgi:hypothetical protein